MLTVRNVGFAYDAGPSLFSGLNVDVPAGHVLAVVGRNGAGKSTFMKLLNGLLKPVAGDILIGGKSIVALRPAQIASDVGTLFQAPEQQLFASRLEEEVAFGPKQLRLSRDEVAERVKDALSKTSLAQKAMQHPLDLSAAERRFAALASVLAMRPSVLLLDEAQRGLDRVWRGRLEDIIAAEREAGRSIVLICHDMNFVERNAQSVLGLGDGAPRQLSTQEFFSDGARLQNLSVDRPTRLRLRAAGENHPRMATSLKQNSL